MHPGGLSDEIKTLSIQVFFYVSPPTSAPHAEGVDRDMCVDIGSLRVLCARGRGQPMTPMGLYVLPRTLLEWVPSQFSRTSA